MSNTNKEADWKRRVVEAAEDALARQQYVCAIDVFVGIGCLAQSHIDAWRKGRLDSLAEVFQGNFDKLQFALVALREWAEAKGLEPTKVQYVRATRDGTVDLRFIPGGDPTLEEAVRIHWVSPALPERKQRQIQERLSQPAKPVVFQILKDSECSECGAPVSRGDLLFMEAQQPLCLPCARMDGLEFLGAGDMALTRRATKFSGRTVVVVRFSRSRGRYERQGILVEGPALAQAERDCAEDASERAGERARAAEARAKQDHQLAADMAERIRALFPLCPPAEAAEIARHTAVRGSGRVGRTEAGRKLEESALNLAVAAAVRHRHTDYDELLGSGVPRELARARVGVHVQKVLAAWKG